MNAILPARPPFALSAVLRSHGWVALAPFESEEPYQAFRRVERLESGRVGDLRVQQTGNDVEVTWNDPAGLEPIPTAEQCEVVDKVSWMLDLGHDFSTFYEIARDEPKLAKVESQAEGRILRSSSVFEDVVKTILTTNTSWSGTIRMTAALVSQFGTPLHGASARRAFPTPEQLAATDEATLRGDAGLGYRAPYVLELARAQVSGRIDMESFKDSDIPTDELYRRLLDIKGVGQYSAAHLLVLLGRYDHVPVDSWALKLVSHEWHDGDPVGRNEVEAAFERWGPWKGLAFWLWDWSYSSGG